MLEIRFYTSNREKSELFAYSKLRRTGSGIALQLLVRGQNRLSGDDFDLWFIAADANGKVLRAGTSLRFVAHKLLDDAILQRMEGDHAQPAAGIKQFECVP